MPVESFYGCALNPDLRPVPGTGEETPDSVRRSYIRRERYDYRADFFGGLWRLETSGAAHRPAPALVCGDHGVTTRLRKPIFPPTIPAPMRFGKQVVLVTGGSSGIGLATAKAFLSEGAKVAISARNLPRLRAATRSLRTFGEVLPIRGDVSKATDARRFALETERRLGPIDVLVNNACIWIEKTLEAFTEAEYDRVMDINLKGAFLCLKYVLPGMVKRRRGVIVNVASDSAFLGAPGSAIYGASKAGLLLMTKCVALEHARDGIRVNAICPGEVRTPMMEADARRLGVRFGEYYRRLAARIPMGRAADPDEIARSILFLASDESSFMTGAALSADGGSTAR